MDTRDYFAGQALNALIQNDEDRPRGKDIKKIASLPFRIADAMTDENDLLPQNDTLDQKNESENTSSKRSE
jgi:hypothetical protein